MSLWNALRSFFKCFFNVTLHFMHDLINTFAKFEKEHQNLCKATTIYQFKLSLMISKGTFMTNPWEILPQVKGHWLSRHWQTVSSFPFMHLQILLCEMTYVTFKVVWVWLELHFIYELLLWKISEFLMDCLSYNHI